MLLLLDTAVRREVIWEINPNLQWRGEATDSPAFQSIPGKPLLQLTEGRVVAGFWGSREEAYNFM